MTLDHSPKVKLSIKTLLFGAVIGAIIGIIAFAPVWAHHNGQYMEYGDYFLQYVPFIKELKRIVATGSLSWSWNSFLGDGLISAYSYYTVYNPFAWIVALFPDQYILYGTMFAIILKLAISMVTSALYIGRFCKKETYALIGALLYTFSGFTLVNTNFYFFLDVVAVFPLVLFGLELLITEQKRGVYVFALFLNATINYYFFVSTVILVIIYVVCRLKLYRISSWKTQWKTFKQIFIYSIIGTGLAGIALIPSFYAILGSGKAAESIGSSVELFYYPQIILEHLRTLVAPIESGRYHAFYDSSTWSSTGVYLPVFGCVCVVQWCFRKKEWLKKICIILLICYFVPVLNAAFNLFSSTAYTRWLYGMALIFSLVTVLTLEEIDDHREPINKKILMGVTLITVILLLVPTVVYFLYKNGISLVNRFVSACTTELFMGYSAIVIMLILTAINYIGLWHIASTKKYRVQNVLTIVVLGCVINFGVYNAINYDLHATDYSNSYYQEKALMEGTEKEETVFEYRIDHPGQIANYGLFKNMPSVNYYNSIQDPGSSEFARVVGIGDGLSDTILLTPSLGGEYTDTLLSVRYYYDYDGDSEIPSGFKYVKTENNVAIYENNNYIPMGFAYDTYCTESQLTNVSTDLMAKTMLQTLVIQDDDEELVNTYLDKQSDVNVIDDLSTLANKRKQTTCSHFLGTTKGFTAEIHLDTDSVVFFSIPNDSGWEITVNGKNANTLSVNYGLLGICCSAGNNQITAVYHTPGWVLGLVCSGAFLLIWILLVLVNQHHRKGEGIGNAFSDSSVL
ncbi:Uncharacterized membrane protein YfhO [Sharpea azabuensis]|uniref:YfhO family protein n=1 Tax=Sharpea azabuensis TaxID=322505 RepID=UPI0008E8F412|nr:YfhO family protein [Sharpea azabuensis]SFE48250.1 Uncharacterized membrane protein YfhO [Sharpea azabuensis]SFL22693.1 Uncharacterized membrane protein YfhO [Sharpea azabuensis]